MSILKSFSKFFLQIVEGSPSKFGEGTSLLWNGCSISLLNQFVSGFFKFKQNFDSASNHPYVMDGGRVFFFESARTSLFWVLRVNGFCSKDEIIVSSFTCDAVTAAILEIGAVPVYVDINTDLTMDSRSLLSAINERTKCVIVQNTFGRLGLSLEFIDMLRTRGLLVVEDCALAFGSLINGKPLGSFGDVSIFSLEVSKTVTIGWGGILRINDDRQFDLVDGIYGSLNRVSLIQDIRRLCQLYFSVTLRSKKIILGGAIWYLLYGLKIFRRSNESMRSSFLRAPRLGRLSQRLFCFLEPDLALCFHKTNLNFKRLSQFSASLGLGAIVVEDSCEFVVSPRFSLFIRPDVKSDLLVYAKMIGVEIGGWFTECPPKASLADCRVQGSATAEYVGGNIINLPCHWGLAEADLKRIEQVLLFLSCHAESDYECQQAR